MKIKFDNIIIWGTISLISYFVLYGFIQLIKHLII